MSDTNRDHVPPPPPPVPPAYATAPPVHAAMPYATRTQESNWPKVIGVIAIVFAAIGILGGLCGAVVGAGSGAVQTAMQSAMQSNPGSAQSSMPFIAEMGRWRTYSILVGLAGAGLQVVLLVAAINLMRRRLWTISVLRIWAGVDIVFSLVGTIASYYMQRDIYQQILSGTGSQGQIPLVVSQASMGVGMVFGIAWSCALPVFVLIWFSRAKIKAETATWS